MQKNKASEKVKPLISRSSNFRTVYVTGAVGNPTPFDYRLAFYNHESQFPETPEQVSGVSIAQVFQIEIVMSYDLMKRLKEMLERQISQVGESTKKTDGEGNATVT